MIETEIINSLSATYYGNTLARWAIALGILIFGTIILRLFKTMLIGKFAAKAQATETALDDITVELITKTRVYFAAAVALGIAVNFISLRPQDLSLLRNITLLAILIQIAVWGNSLTDQLVNNYSKRHLGSTDGKTNTTIRTIAFAAKLFIVFILALIALQQLGANLTTLLAGLGIGGIAVALAVQNILGDLFAAVSIMIDKPFVVGDAIQVDNVEGTVEKIGLKTTRVRSYAGEQIIVSNGDLLKSRIRNFRRMQQRRIVFTLQFSTTNAPEKMNEATKIIKEIIETEPRVRFGRSHFTTIRDTSLSVETVYFVTTPNYDRYLEAQHSINLQILQRCGDEGIQMASPIPPVTIQTLSQSSAS